MTTDTPLVPIAVTSARCWPRKSFVLRPGVINISIGKPIPATGREPDELMREVERWVETEMRRLDPEAYARRGEDGGPGHVNFALMPRRAAPALLDPQLSLFDVAVARR